MLHKTRAIVLYNVNYNDTYTIVHVFTEALGPVSYLTAKTKGKTTRVPKSLFHPLSVVELEVEHQNVREIQRLKEARQHIALPSIRNHPVKSTICIFLAELLGKITVDKQSDQRLFDFILQSVEVLEMMEKDYANFHLVFMIGLSRYLGFYPDSSGYRPGMYFDLQNGVFVAYRPASVHFLNPDESQVFFNLLRMNYENMALFSFSRHERKDIIYRILEYYRIHLNRLPEIKSLEILHEVFG
ncbi:MAG: DNA repair protein RecO [Dysgonamonadaceae bacterium]|jgi:DNA repair protein RecO (recombination protein O)|nr:DNA repair protein RecO [Dysgonamonadaceae bacterium]